jgi:hypothetical protein
MNHLREGEVIESAHEALDFYHQIVNLLGDVNDILETTNTGNEFAIKLMIVDRLEKIVERIAP